MDYKKLAKCYKPDIVKILLIGEAPPPNGKKYFYSVPKNYSFSGNIEKDTSLPATIFNHYFGRRPNDSDEYKKFLECLKEKGVFLIDMYKEPEKFRGDKENQKKSFTDCNIKQLNDEILSLKTDVLFKVIFLLARQYTKEQRNKLKAQFPNAEFIRWKEFRMKVNENIECK